MSERYFKVILTLCFLFSNGLSAQRRHYAKKVEVYSELDYTQLLSKSGEKKIATFRQDKYTSEIYDAQEVDGGVLIRNKWTVNYYNDNLQKIREFKFYPYVRSYALSRTLMRKSGESIYLIRMNGPEKRPDEFRRLKVVEFPINGTDKDVKEIDLKLPYFLEKNTVSCEVIGNNLIAIGQMKNYDRYYFVRLNLENKKIEVSKLEMPSTNSNIMSEESHRPWSHLFHTKEHFWMYEFYTTKLKKKVREIVMHVVKIDMDGVILREHTFNLSSLSAEMAELYSFAPGLTYDKELERVFIIGPSTNLEFSKGNAGYLYFASYDLNSGAELVSRIINASELVEFIPDDYKFNGLKTISTNRDPTQLSETTQKLRPMFYDPMNKSLMVDFFFGNTGFGEKLEIIFKRLRLIFDDRGNLFRLGIIDDYVSHLQDGRQIKFIEPEGFVSKFWDVTMDEKNLRYNYSGYDLLTEEISEVMSRRPLIMAKVIHKRGFDLLVLFEEDSFRTTIYKTFDSNFGR